MKIADTTDQQQAHSESGVLPRLGQINFCNSLPFNLPILDGRVDLRARFVEGNPQHLNQLIAAGELELSSVSSFFYAKNPDYVLLPEVSISSTGPVGSVLFFHKRPLPELAGRRLAVPRSSATSVRLLAILLRLEAGVEADFQVVAEPDLSDESHEGALIIGDEALRVDPDWSRQAERIDLGQWWVERFQLPMVFGIWVASPEFSESCKEQFLDISAALHQARTIGCGEMLPAVIEKSVQLTGLPPARMSTYFNDELNFELSQEHRKSIDLYRQLCQEHNLV